MMNDEQLKHHIHENEDDSTNITSFLSDNSEHKYFVDYYNIFDTLHSRLEAVF